MQFRLINWSYTDPLNRWRDGDGEGDGEEEQATDVCAAHPENSFDI